MIKYKCKKCGSLMTTKYGVLDKPHIKCKHCKQTHKYEITIEVVKCDDTQEN